MNRSLFPLFVTGLMLTGVSTFAQSPMQRSSQMPVRPDGLTDWPAFWSRGAAKGSGPVELSHLPMRAEDIEVFVPYGMTAGGHVCPIDHAYFFPKRLGEGEPHFQVFAPADGFVVVIGHRTQLTGSTERQRDYDDYALVIEHSGTFYTQYDLLTSLDASLMDQLEPALRSQITGRTPTPQVQVRIPVKAGEVIGRVGGRSLDFGVVNTERKLAGFLSPSLYGHYSWRVHLADPFEFFSGPAKTALLALNARKVPPFGGRIDYDVDGRLVGNWFLEGSGGYAGNRKDPRGYWMGHLAFAYHHIDPDKVVASFGDYGGQPKAFWVKGNQPDPATISEREGVVKLELVYAELGGQGKKFEGIPGDVQGVALVQVLPGRKLKCETFPGKSAAEVSGFTSNAKTYER